MKKYKYVLFDADGTLFDFERTEHEALKKTFESADIEFSTSNISAYLEANEKLWNALEQGKISMNQVKIDRFVNFFKAINNKSDAEKYANEYIYNLGLGAYLLDGAVDIVKALYGKCSLNIATNGIADVQRPRMSSSELKGYFDNIFISEEIGYPKPNVEYFNYIFDALQVSDKSHVIIIGDSLTSDMQGGINAGIDTCFYNSNNINIPSDMDITYEIDDLSKLKDIIL